MDHEWSKMYFLDLFQLVRAKELNIYVGKSAPLRFSDKKRRGSDLRFFLGWKDVLLGREMNSYPIVVGIFEIGSAKWERSVLNQLGVRVIFFIATVTNLSID